MSTEAEIHRQNERFELLLNLATRITSSLNLREVLRAVAANIREVTQADGVTVSLSEPTSGKSRLFAMDFPHSNGGINDELTVAPSAVPKNAMDPLQRDVID